MVKLDTLPNELALVIVRHVRPRDWHACSLINRQFHSVTNPLLWHSLNVESKNSFTKLIAGMDAAAAGATTEPLSPLGSLIRHVHLDSFLTDEQFLTFMKHASLVEDLMLEAAVNITDASARHLPAYCPNLKRLDISYSNITQQSLQGLGSCHQLSQLKLLSCPGMPFNSFHAVAACPLKILMAYACGKKTMNQCDDDDDEYADVDDDDVDHDLSDETLQLAGQRTINETVLDIIGFKHLTSLALFHCPPAFLDKLLTTLATATPVIWPHLTTLSLNEFDSLPEANALTVIRAHRSLTLLVLESNSFTDHFLNVVGFTLPGIETLGLSGSSNISAHGVRKLIEDCPVLEHVRLSGCEITIDDFPEATSDSLDNDDPYFITELDEYAINEIRQGHNYEDDEDFQQFLEEWEEKQRWKEEMFNAFDEDDDDLGSDDGDGGK